MPDAVINALKKAIKGLSYTSETDEPFQAVSWDGGDGPLTGETLLKLSKQKPGSKVEEVPVAEFFGDLTEEQDWHQEAEKKAVGQYKGLLETLEQALSDVKVFKVGEVNLDIYIIGKTKDGKWAGVKTAAVET